MKKNQKGLSTIVATLLIILLVLVAVGIIWVVVRNVVEGGTEQIDLGTKCLESEVSVTKVVNSTATDFNVTLSRTGGNDEIGGVRLVFTNEAEDSNFIEDVSGNIAYLATKTTNVTILTEDLENPNQVVVVVYFLDSSENQLLCTASESFEF